MLKRLLQKGRIVFKRAYCDWSNYRSAVREFHAHGIEMVDIPRSKVSGKNSADIHMVVDAMDLCYSKQHIDIFALLSGDSDFSPLVSKLKENDKRVIGCGVKSSTSDLLIANCDEFIYYDDIVRDQTKKSSKKAAPPRGRSTKRKASKARPRDKKQEAIDLAIEVASALDAERGDQDKLWGSMVKQALKRVKPGFNEGYYGFRSFSGLLEEAQARGQLDLELDERSGGYIIRNISD